MAGGFGVVAATADRVGVEREAAEGRAGIYSLATEMANVRTLLGLEGGWRV